MQHFFEQDYYTNIYMILEGVKKDMISDLSFIDNVNTLDINLPTWVSSGGDNSIPPRFKLIVIPNLYLNKELFFPEALSVDPVRHPTSPADRDDEVIAQRTPNKGGKRTTSSSILTAKIEEMQEKKTSLPKGATIKGGMDIKFID
jgi:hypothetical protein